MSTHGPDENPNNKKSIPEIANEGMLGRLKEESVWGEFDNNTNTLRKEAEEKLRSTVRAGRNSRAGALEQRNPGAEIKPKGETNPGVDILLEDLGNEPLEVTPSQEIAPSTPERKPTPGLADFLQIGTKIQGVHKKSPASIPQVRVNTKTGNHNEITPAVPVTLTEGLQSFEDSVYSKDSKDSDDLRTTIRSNLEEEPTITEPRRVTEESLRDGAVDIPLPLTVAGDSPQKLSHTDRQYIPTLSEVVPKKSTPDIDLSSSEFNTPSHVAVTNPNEHRTPTAPLTLDTLVTETKKHTEEPIQNSLTIENVPNTFPLPLKKTSEETNTPTESTVEPQAFNHPSQTYPVPLSHTSPEQQPVSPILHFRKTNRPRRRAVAMLKDVVGKAIKWQKDVRAAHQLENDRKRKAKQQEDAEFDGFLDDIDLTSVKERLEKEKAGHDHITHTTEVDESKEQPTAIPNVTIAMVQKNIFEVAREEAEEKARIAVEKERNDAEAAMAAWQRKQDDFASQVYKKLEPEANEHRSTLRDRIKRSTLWLKGKHSKNESSVDSAIVNTTSTERPLDQNKTPEQIRKEERLLAGNAIVTENTHKIRKSTLETIGLKGKELLNTFDKAAHFLDKKTTAKQRLGLGLGISAAALGSVFLTSAPIIGATAVITVAGISVRALTAASSYVAFKKILDTMVKNQEAFDKNRDDDDHLQGFKVPETYKRLGALSSALMAAALGQIVAEHVVPSLASYVTEHLPNLNTTLSSLGVPSLSDNLPSTPVSTPTPIATPDITPAHISTPSVAPEILPTPTASVTPEVSIPSVTETITSSISPELIHHTVAPGETVWDILKHTLSESNFDGFNTITDGNVKNQKILEMLGKIMEDPKSFGISSGNINTIRPNEVLDFSKLFN